MAIAALPVIARRSARAIRNGGLANGSGIVTAGSGALGDLPVTWASRSHEGEDAFKSIVDEAIELRPISRLLAGAAITVDAYLDGT